MVSRIQGSVVVGIDASLVEVEVDVSPGLPSFTIVGLPETSVRESRERVKSAIANSGYAFPDDRITVNLAPAHVKKTGTGFDLPIALGILCANRTISDGMRSQYLILGELSLDGRIKPVTGALCMAIAAREAGIQGVVVPSLNRREASVVEGISVFAVKTLSEALEFIKGDLNLTPEPSEPAEPGESDLEEGVDFAEVLGQEHAKRALEVAAAGGHNLIMVGPPGSGKTMLARRLPTLLPPLSFEEAIETTRIYSVVGMLEKDQHLMTRRPFRAPHHTISDAGLIGGGHVPRPGEVSLAHHGVLFLDEFPEYKKHVLEALRQPLEDQEVTLSRAASVLTYPAAFMLVAAMNPCPCGYYGDPKHECRCTDSQILKYRSRISGPLMDRIDIHVEVPAVPHREIRRGNTGEPSASIRKRVSEARKIQRERFAKTRTSCNARMVSRQIKKHCPLDPPSLNLLESAMDRLGLSARAYNRILKIARTLADLAGKEAIEADQIAEAIQYRSLDRGKSFP